MESKKNQPASPQESPTPNGEEVKTLVISRGKEVLIDAVDLPLVTGFTWTPNNCGYVRAFSAGRTVLMHRLIVSASAGEFVDHINHNGFDNRRANLRICTRSENNRNRGKRSDSRCLYKGINRREGGFVARLRTGGKEFHSQVYQLELDAARAYDQMALLHFGEFALLNFPKDGVK